MIEKAAQETIDWLDKHGMAEKEECQGKQQQLEGARSIKKKTCADKTS